MLCVPGSVLADETTPEPVPIGVLTLDDALRVAEQQRPELEALRARAGIAEGDAQQAGLWPNPTFSFGVEGYTPNGAGRPTDLTAIDNLAEFSNRTRSRATTIGSALFPDSPVLIPGHEWWIPGVEEQTNPDQMQRVASIAQPLPVWGTRGVARKAGLLEVERWRREYDRARLELHAEVKIAFDDLLIQQHRVETYELLAKTLSDILEKTRARLNAGEIAEVAVIKGEADYERFSIEVEAAHSELLQAESRLAHALGNPNARPRIQGTAIEIPQLPEDLVTTVAQGHPQREVWDAATRAADAQVKLQKSLRFPAPTLSIGYRHYAYTGQDTFDLSLEFEVPIFDRKQGDIRAAREKARLEEANIRAELSAFDAHLAQSHVAYASHRKNAETYTARIIPKLEETLDIARASFDAGDVSMLEVLDAYRTLAEARLSALNEIMETRRAYHELIYLSATGGVARDQAE